MGKDSYLISDAAKQVQVEAHVLRYWEEELELPIRRNELGHRYYTSQDVERFKEIKELKERGLQLKAIRMILKDGKINMIVPGKEETGAGAKESEMNAAEKKDADRGAREQGGLMAIEVIDSKPLEAPVSVENREEKAKRLQWLLQQMMREVLKENNQELSQEIKDSVVKELDYQFRIQEERDEEKYRERTAREEEHYKKIDEMLRRKRGLFKK